VQLLQPQDVALTPLAFLALGAAGVTVTPPRRIIPIALQVAVVGAAFAFAVIVLVGGYREWRAYEGSRSDAIAVAKMFPHWPDRTALAEAAIVSSDQGTATERIDDARGWALQGVARDARDVRMYMQATVFDLLSNDLTSARANAEEGVRLSPWSPIALTNLAEVQKEEGENAAAIANLKLALEIQPNYGLAKQILASLSG